MNAIKDLRAKQDTNNQLKLDKLQPLMEVDKKEQNPYHPYNNQFHKESSERKMKKLDEQKNLTLNSKEEAKKMFEMHERIAKNYPNGNE
ncbi:MAG: hypothetical protein WCG08_11135 [Paludibacter sp.]